MKKISYFLSLLMTLIIVSSCNKALHLPTGSTPVKFTNTTYDSLATYDMLGKPSNLVMPRDSISPSLTSFIYDKLPKAADNFKAHPELFTSTANATLNFTQKTDVTITFVQETAVYLSTVGFYTFQTNNPPTNPSQITNIKYIFPNCSALNSGGELLPGDKVDIGTYLPGTSMGFVLMENSYKPETHSIYTIGNHFCSADILNPENDASIRRHVVILDYPTINPTLSLISFEDTDRSNPTNDNDFDDVTIYATQVVVK